jgi:hypothetical protein
MNDGLSQALSIQSYMSAELSSIRGTLYFLSHFLLLLFITSFQRYSPARLGCLAILCANLLSEVTIGNLVESYMGTHRFRYLFIALELFLIWQTSSNKNELEEAISVHLNTPRLKSVFRKAFIENEAMAYRLCSLSSLHNQECRQAAKMK